MKHIHQRRTRTFLLSAKQISGGATLRADGGRLGDVSHGGSAYSSGRDRNETSEIGEHQNLADTLTHWNVV